VMSVATRMGSEEGWVAVEPCYNCHAKVGWTSDAGRVPDQPDFPTSYGAEQNAKRYGSNIHENVVHSC
jgi:hypothetical protein